MRLRRNVFFLIALLAMALPSVYAQNAAGHVSKMDDAYHLKYWEGSPYNAAYREWWYFNLYDRQDNLQAIFTYQVGDPLDLTGQGASDLTAVVYEGQNIVTESDIYPLTAFTASYSAADVTLGANTVSADGPNKYHIAGATRDGRLSWDLGYRRETSSWFAGDHVNVAPLPWEQMSWLVYMPRAWVSGTLTVDGRTYDIDCSGYHDHNWGQWYFPSVIWNWAQYSERDLAFDLGDFVGSPNGRARIEVGGRQVIFAADQYRLVHTKWGFDSVNNLPYPTQSVFTAENGKVKVHMVMDILKTDALATGPPPSLVIYEQPSHFRGRITVEGDEYPRRLELEGDGFKEYTATKAAP